MDPFEHTTYGVVVKQSPIRKLLRGKEYGAGYAGSAVAGWIGDQIVDGLVDDERGAIGVGEAVHAVVERPGARSQQKHRVSVLVSDEVADVASMTSVHQLFRIEVRTRRVEWFLSLRIAATDGVQMNPMFARNQAVHQDRAANSCAVISYGDKTDFVSSRIH